MRPPAPRSRAASEPNESRPRTKSSQLETQDQQIEPLRFFVFICQLAREIGDLVGKNPRVFLRQRRPGTPAREALDDTAPGTNHEVVQIHRGNLCVKLCRDVMP
jgi:hypothetical protein